MRKNSKSLSKIIKKYEPELKLDIGCGKHKKPGYIGIDIDKNSDADMVCSALALPFKDSTVSEIHCSHLVEHLSLKEAQKFFDEIYRVLKDGGRAWLKIDRDWSEKRLFKKDPEHKKRYSAKEIKAMVKKFKFSKVENKIYRFGWHFRQKIFVELKKTPLKIGIVTSSLSKTDGWGRYSFEIVKELKNFGEVKVIACPILPDPLSHPLKIALYFFKVIKHLKDCDIIHCLVEPYAPMVAIANSILKKPFIISGVGTYAVAPLNTIIQGTALKYAYRNAAKIVCISRFTEQEILKRVSLKNTCVVNLGVDYDKFKKPSAFNRKKFSEKIIVSVGALKSRKGYHVSIPAVGKAKKRYPNLQYYIVGGQSIKNCFNKLKNLVKKCNLEKNVIFLENISDEELISLYSRANLFLLTPVNINNNFEGFGLVYLEANACGIPVIGSGDCGVEDVIEHNHNGLLVPQNNIKKTAKAILYLLDNPKIARNLGKNGREKAKRMTWKNTVSQYLEIYKNLLR